jgi:hypothetical protein
MSKTTQKVAELSIEQSKVLTRNLLRTSLATICFFRGLLPDDCFRTHNLSGLSVRQLLPGNEQAQLLLSWLEEGVLQALAKGYLAEFIFAIHERVPTAAGQTSDESSLRLLERSNVRRLML